MIDVARESEATDAGARGVLFVHAAARALAQHLEWAVGGVLGRRVNATWSSQPVLPGAIRTEFTWVGQPGSAAAIASSLMSFDGIRFEVTEDPQRGREGERYAFVPELGLFRATVGLYGDVLVHEDRLRAAITQARITGESLESELALLIGDPWDVALEPYRFASNGVRVLSQVV